MAYFPLLEKEWHANFVLFTFNITQTQQQQATSDQIHSVEKNANATDQANGSECKSSSPPLSNDEFQSVNIFEQLPCQATPTPTPTPSIAMIFMKIRLTESDDFLLFENNSYTLVRDSKTTEKVDKDDGDEKKQQQWRRLRPIQYLVDNDKNRGRTNNVETQTVDAHYKTRAINTNQIEKSTGV